MTFVDKNLEQYLKRNISRPSQNPRLALRDSLVPPVYLQSDLDNPDQLATSSSDYLIGSGEPSGWLRRQAHPWGQWGTASDDSCSFLVPWDGWYTMTALIKYSDSFNGGAGTASIVYKPSMGTKTFWDSDRYLAGGRSAHRVVLQGTHTWFCEAQDALELRLWWNSTPDGGASQGTHEIERVYWWINFLG